MHLKKHKLLHTEHHNNIGEAEDRISELPDPILHHILSFLDIKPVARTSILSKRWNDIWTSIPTLEFPFWFRLEPLSLSETNKFMEFVDRTLLLHDTSSNIQKFHLKTNRHMSASRVNSWISNLTKRNVKEVNLYIDQRRRFYIPWSLFTCESLVKLELSVGKSNKTTHLPKTFCFPKLKSLALRFIKFIDDDWNEQHFYNCPVLESLILQDCTWSDVGNFCISTPSLKLLEIDNDRSNNDGLQHCALSIHAPNLVSLAYCGCVPKELFFSSFQKLKYARVFLICKYRLPMEQKIGYGEAVRKFIRTLSNIRCLEIYAEALQTFSIVDDFVSMLPTFHGLYELILKQGKTITDKSLFPLLKAVPNLRWLTFEEGCIDDDIEEELSWVSCHMLTAGCMFQHLESATFHGFSRDARQMRWVKLILKNAKSLRTISLSLNKADEIKEELKSELLSLPRASKRFKFEFEEC